MMGLIWLQTTDGHQIHIPIVEADYNTPDDPVKIPVGIVVTANRCLDGTFSVNLPDGGSVTVDFRVPGRTGTCNQCGQCCTHPIDACPDPGGNCGWLVDTARNIHRCQHLVIKQRGIGKSNGTECGIRDSILDLLKGCAFFPSSADQILPHMTACSFTFTG